MIGVGSDIDLLLVVERGFEEKTLNPVLDVLAETTSQFDLTALTPKYLNANSYPTPFLFAIKMNSKVIHKPEGSIDFVFIRQDVHQNGKLLYSGSPIAVEMVPLPLLRRAVQTVYPHIVGRFRNPVLNICRCVYTWKTGSIISKSKAGEWGAKELPAQ